ncbi:MAG TPA: hypothetical protein VH120_02030 [Gemmataceae bacterium]|jgi:hypothetical protein|nr:hypothetical protein [Gemmataceae bacterium]
MKWLRTMIAAGVLAGVGFGCSKTQVASVPANAPRPDDEKPLPPPGQRGPAAKTLSPPISR